MSLSDFINMGGYGAYVWPCYLLTVVVLIGMEWASRNDLKAVQRQALRRAQVAAGDKP